MARPTIYRPVPPQPTPPKQRHGCLTAWLVLAILGNSLLALLVACLYFLAGPEVIRRTAPNLPGWAFPFMIAAGIFNVLCAVALFRWKKWGFWGFVATTVLAFAINLYHGLTPTASSTGLLGIAILYGVLNVGKDRRGWDQLD